MLILALLLVVERLQFLYGQFFIDFRLVFNAFCTSTESQSGRGLVQVVVRWTARDDERCLGIATKGLLKYSGQFRITVWDMCRFAISQLVDNFAEISQTFIDHIGLFKELTFGSSFLDSLRASQINKVQLSCRRAKRLQIRLLHRDNKASV